MSGRSWADTALERALDSVEERLDEDVYPHITEDGQWVTSESGFWTGGFWIGLLWAGYEERGDDRFRAAAERLLERFVDRAGEEHNHDLGMMFGPSAVRGWELTGETRYRDAALRAAGTLAGQLNEQGGFIPGWGFFGDGNGDWRGRALVDTLMNLPLLMWASEQTGDDRYREAALAHGRTSLSHHLRPDGATYHVFRFDPDTGAPIGGETYQGLNDTSCWSRGQAWTIVGCSQLAAAGAGEAFYEGATRAARWYVDHLPDDLIPYWDFEADPSDPRDASAGAIAAYGLLLLDELGGDLPAAEVAEASLESLSRLAQAPAGHPAILLRATADLPHGFGIDESTIYGDYFYVEALRRLQRVSVDDARPGLEAPGRGRAS